MLKNRKEHCGVFGIFGHPEASNLAYLGLYALQHRGHESAGIVSSDKEFLYVHREMGLVSDVFSQETLKKLKGDTAIGHVRYSTAGMSDKKNAQPLIFSYSRGAIAVAHNGNLVNGGELRETLEEQGRIFQSTSDTEVIIHLMAISRKPTLVEKIIEALHQIQGAYALVFLSEKEMVAVRDPHGFRPLVLGNLNAAPVISSETCALDLIEADYVREIEPGEAVVVNDDGIHSFRFAPEDRKYCIFELVYFARPDSDVFGREVYSARKEMGRQLAREHPVNADIVIPVPDSGMPAAIGYAEESGIPYDIGLIRNRYVGRTFIEPKQSIRHFGVKLKLNPVKELLKGKRIIVIDDSIVRATTSKKIVSLLRTAGAREIHMRISSPPTCFSCYYGIDTPTRQELIASSHTVEQIGRFIDADSVAYLSVEGMKRSVGHMKDKICCACFTGEYPMPVQEEQFVQLRLFEPI